MIRAWRSHLLLGAILLYLGLFLGLPLLVELDRAVTDEQGYTLSHLTRLFRDPAHLEAVTNSASIACWTTLTTFVIALPLALLFSRREFAGKSLFQALLLLPMILPPFVGAVGMKTVFSRVGPLSLLAMASGITDQPIDWLGAYPLPGIVLLESLHLYPILFLNLLAALANVDPTLEAAALNCGASPLRVFRRVTLPLAGPGLFAGLVLVFVWSFTELGTPLIFAYRNVLPVQIYDAVGEVQTRAAGHAQVVFVLLVTALGFWISKTMTSRHRTVATLGRTASARIRKTLTGTQAAAVLLLLSGFVLIASLPHLSVAAMAFSRRWFMTVLPQGWTTGFATEALGLELTRISLANSLLLATCATAVDLVLGFGIAWLCLRSKFRGVQWLDSAAMLPLAVPGVVIAFGYLSAFSGLAVRTAAWTGTADPEASWLVSAASLLDPRVSPMLLLVAAYSMRRLPYMVRAAHAGLEQIHPLYEDAAASLGAGPWRTVWRVTRPLILANLLAGAVLAFSFSMLEVSDSLILAQSENHYPLTKAMYALMSSLEYGVNLASALGLWAMALLATALLWAACLMGSRLGRMFRAG